MFVDFQWIIGLSFGIEYVRIEDSDFLAIDLGVVRVVLEKPVE